MKWKEWLEKWSMTGLKISTGFLEMEWQPKDADRDAAWEMYIELLTRIMKFPTDSGRLMESVCSLEGVPHVQVS
ncbi:MAG: hypothetical protein KDA88_17065 [Planctomycetaceae bacterium]|nr:hypothetical protein [Planctomycetaceae bacterium]MCB9951671.1 hypothetical protein [Planctomycetaceae bacterium]